MSQSSRIDVLLTYPKDGLRLFQSMIPIGLVSIGSVLEKAGYRVLLIDFNHYANDFRRQIAFLRPKIIGIGGTTPSRMDSFLTARLSKRVLPDTPVVYGGINATFTSSEVLGNVDEIDYVIKGEGELSFLQLCDVLLRKSKGDVADIPGLCWRSGGGVLENKPKRLDDLSVLPIPNRDLLGDFYKLEMEFIGGAGDFIMTSRGCPAACNFCSASRMFPGGIRLRPMPSVMDEVDYLLSRKKLSGLKIFDSTFTASRDHVERFCLNIRKFKIPWECEIRADTVDADLLGLMKDSGCYYINIGMETSDETHLKRISKGITTKQVQDVLSICKKYDIRSKVFFTFGHIDQTFDECLEDISFIGKNKDKIDFFAVTVGMRVYPGTRLEKECRDRNIMGKDFSWLNSAKRLKNLLLFEPSDTLLLFQKQLGPFRLLFVLCILFKRKCICTEKFLVRMLAENAAGILAGIKLRITYGIHTIERLMGKGLGERVWAGTVHDAGKNTDA